MPSRVAPMMVSVESSPVLLVLAELTEIAGRRRSLPEFAELFRQIVDALPSAFETHWVNLENNPAAARDLTLALQFTEPFLALVTALRALDRNFDAG